MPPDAVLPILDVVCSLGHSMFKCFDDCPGRERLIYRQERDSLLADAEPIPTEDE